MIGKVVVAGVCLGGALALSHTVGQQYTDINPPLKPIVPIIVHTYTPPTWTPNENEKQWPPVNEDPIDVPDLGGQVPQFTEGSFCQQNVGIQHCGEMRI